jgi:hypothetical protein
MTSITFRLSSASRLLFDHGLVRDIQYIPGQLPSDMLAPLDDPEYFAQVQVEADAGTLVWPNGLDPSPGVLHGDYEPERALGFDDVTPDHQPA